jgi:hypothetical protein
VNEDEVTPVIGLKVRDVDIDIDIIGDYAGEDMEVTLSTSNGGTLRIQDMDMVMDHHLRNYIEWIEGRPNYRQPVLQMRGSVNDINEALAEMLDYRSSPHYHGPDSLIIEVSDLGNSGLTVSQISNDVHLT